MKKFLPLSAVTLTVLLLTGCDAPASPLDEAETLGGEFVEVVCQLSEEEKVTQTYLDDLEAMAAKYDNATPPSDDQGNDWLKYDVLSNALRERITALEPRLGDEITDDWREDLTGQCGFISTSYEETFTALN